MKKLSLESDGAFPIQLMIDFSLEALVILVPQSSEQ